MYFYRFFFTLNLVQCSCVVSSELVSSSSIILWKKNISDPFTKMKMTLVSPKRLHLDKNYYRHMIAPFVPCNFGYTNLPLGLIDSKIFKVLIVTAPPGIKGLSESVCKVFNKNNVSVGFKGFNSLNKLIKVHKDRTSLEQNNNVIYKIHCKDCDASYVGQTKR